MEVLFFCRSDRSCGSIASSKGPPWQHLSPVYHKYRPGSHPGLLLHWIHSQNPLPPNDGTYVSRMCGLGKLLPPSLSFALTRGAYKKEPHCKSLGETQGQILARENVSPLFGMTRKSALVLWDYFLSWIAVRRSCLTSRRAWGPTFRLTMRKLFSSLFLGSKLQTYIANFTVISWYRDAFTTLSLPLYLFQELPWDIFVPRALMCEQPLRNCTFLWTSVAQTVGEPSY